MTPRFVRHLIQLSVPPPSDGAIKAILSTILGAFLSDWSPDLKALCGPIVASAVEAFNTISAELLPTPDKSHYNFNLRDLSKVAQVSRLPEAWLLCCQRVAVRGVVHVEQAGYATTPASCLSPCCTCTLAPTQHTLLNKFCMQEFHSPAHLQYFDDCC